MRAPDLTVNWDKDEMYEDWDDEVLGKAEATAYRGLDCQGLPQASIAAGSGKLPEPGLPQASIRQQGTE